jgi:hypothetical protein
MNKLISIFLGGLLLAMPVSASDYSDVYESEPVDEALDYLTSEDIVEGYDDGTFQPLNLINRAEYTKMVVEAFTEETPDEDEYQDCFNDVDDEWYAPYVCYSQEQEWVEGYGNGFFMPGDNITRAEAVKIIAAVLEWEVEASWYEGQFNDIGITEWYGDYLWAAEEKNLFDKLDSYISPHEYISRSQMSQLLYRALLVEEGEDFEIFELSDDTKTITYQEMLDSGIEPAYPDDMTFASNSQSAYPYGCYAFATKNILEWKYDWFLDIAEVQEAIGWDGTFIWSPSEFLTFAEEYEVDVIFTYNGTAEFFFKKLASGEPMVLYIPYYSGGRNIGHNLVAYSFDDDGVWVADSLSGGLQRHIGYDEVFVDSDTSTTNLTQLRKLKGNGTRRDQVMGY